MKIIMSLLTLLCFAFAGPVLAHVKQSDSIPAHNAMLMQAPTTLSINFTGPIRLTKVELVQNDNSNIDFGFTATAAAARFSWPLPLLDNGSYQVSWVGLGEDGHKMKGEIRFVLQTGAAAAVKADTAPTHQH